MEYIIYTATIPSALTGVDIVIFASAFAYISDISNTENRTLRITILELSYLVTLPTGIALGMYLQLHLQLQSFDSFFRIPFKIVNLFSRFLSVQVRFWTFVFDIVQYQLRLRYSGYPLFSILFEGTNLNIYSKSVVDFHNPLFSFPPESGERR